MQRRLPQSKSPWEMGVSYVGSLEDLPSDAGQVQGLREDGFLHGFAGWDQLQMLAARGADIPGGEQSP